jgi:peroxiredoxin
MAAAGAALLAVSPQTPDNSLTTAEKNALEFSVLSDAGNRVASSFGLVFRVPDSLRPYYDRIGISFERANGDASQELPVPATYVVGRDGRVLLAHVDPDYTRRLEPAALLAALRAEPRGLHQDAGH